MQINNLKNILKNFEGDFKIDSREIKPGDIFISLKGSKDHGNNYISDAINKKAKSEE